MPIHEFIRESYLRYLRHIGHGGKRVALPPYEHRPGGEDKVHASDLGGCPLAAARKRRKEAKPYPESPAAELSRLHLLQQGVRDAEPIQEALVWATGGNAEAEKNVEDKQLRGKIDVWLPYHGYHLIELKRRDTPKSEDIPQPKLTDILQLLAYMRMTGVESAYIVTINRYHLNSWSFQGQRGGYVIVNEDGELWSSDLNTPSIINMTTLDAEIDRQQRYLKAELPECPLPNFLEHPEGWRCYHWEKQPKFYKTKGNAQKYAGDYMPSGKGYSSIGTIRPRCEYFCHGDPHDIRVIASENGYKEYL